MIKNRLEKFFNYYAESTNKVKNRELNGLDLFVKEYKNRNEKLYNLLGQRRIYKFPVEVKLDTEDIESMINVDKKFNNYCFDIWHKLNAFFKSHREYSRDEEDVIINFFGMEKYYATNVYSGPEFTFEGVTIRTGCKMLKHCQIILKKIKYDKDKIDDFINYVSTFRNQSKLAGNLCISIDPIDFLTASTNKCGWTSCYDLFHPESIGYNAAANIEYLFNENCVIAYLESKKPMMIGDLECSNKKWREYFYIEDNVITNIKGYPYKNDNLTLLVLNKLKELAETNWGLQDYYTETPFLFHKGKSEDTDIQVVPFFSKDTAVYEDDYSSIENTHYCYLHLPEYEFQYDVYILDFTKFIICPFCGRINERTVESSIACVNCAADIFCYSCGYTIKDKELYEVYDKTTKKIVKICRDCLFDEDNEFGYLLDQYTNKPVEKSKVKYIEIAVDEKFLSFVGLQVSEDSYDKVFKPGTKIKTTPNFNYSYVYYDELTAEGLKTVFDKHDYPTEDIPKCEYDFLRYAYIKVNDDRNFIAINEN